MGRKGKLIVFVGSDGVGKTTLINQVINDASATCNIKYFHIKFNTIPRLGVIIKSLKSKLFSQNKSSNKEVLSDNKLELTRHIYNSQMSYWKLLTNITFDIFDYILGYLITLRFNKNLVVFDRYIYEFYTELNCKRMPLSVMRFYMRIVPEPDLIFYLHNDPTTVYQRKPELSIAEISEVQSRIDVLLSRKKNLIKIKTDRPVKELSNIILDSIECHEK